MAKIAKAAGGMLVAYIAGKLIDKSIDWDALEKNAGTLPHAERDKSYY